MPTETRPLNRAILSDLEVVEEQLIVVEAGEQPEATDIDWLCVDLGDTDPSTEDAAARVLGSVEPALAERGRALITGARAATQRDLAALRNRLWPTLHYQRVYRASDGTIERTDVNGKSALDEAGEDGFVVACLRREAAMAPDVTAEKFDAKAAGWNGDPGSPQYGHHRWMRRLLALCAKPRQGERTIDAGSGAGWVGIEAAIRGADLSAFDPSPEMVKFVRSNAEEAGVAVDARVGFVEEPPFDGDFELVLNSGVISFAPDPEHFLDGIDRLVKKGGRLVIGDLNPKSRGFARRRRGRLIIPVRELNGVTREEMIERLKKRGYDVDFVRYYQLTWPIPELGHHSRSHLVCWVLLQWNRGLSALDAMFGSRAAWAFDSWIVGATKRR